MSLAATVSRVDVGVIADGRGQEPLRPVAAMVGRQHRRLPAHHGRRAGADRGGGAAGGQLWLVVPGGLTLAVVQRSPGAPAWAVGVLTAGLFSGVIAGPLLVAVLAEHERFALAWGACAAFALLAACTVLAVREAAVPRRA